MSKFEDRKKLITDLWIIGLTTFLALGIVIFAMKKGLNDFAYDVRFPIVLRVLVIGLSQFAASGLGILIVCIVRKQSFREFGLNTKNLIPALLLSIFCCVPDFLFYVSKRYLNSWSPFQSVNTTYEVLRSSFPSNVIAYLITALCWGFFEGFNYVVKRQDQCCQSQLL